MLNIGKPQRIRKQQSGAALVVSLIILLILTVLGVNSMSSLVLEEKMASNTRQTMIAAQQADAAIRAAELFVATNVNFGNMSQFSNGTAGLYSQRTPILLPFDRFDSALWLANGVEVATVDDVDPAGPKTDLVGRNPRYIIEYIGRVGEDQRLNPNSPTPDTRDYGFRITAIGWGEDTNASFIAQSTVRTSL